MRFAKKVAVVTGGAGGVGRALVRKLAGEGAAVMVADLSAEGCRSLVEEIEAVGGEIDVVAGDVRDREHCERVVAATVERFGGVDILFNNAGIIPRGTILETSDEMWHAALDVNLTAMFYLCRAAIPVMKERGEGRSSTPRRCGGCTRGRDISRTAPARERWRRSRRAWAVTTLRTASG